MVAAIGTAAFLLALGLVLVYNRLVAGRNKVEQAFADIDVQLKRRHDLIPKLLDAVKGVMEFEKTTLQKVVQARARAMAAPDRKIRLSAEAGLSALIAPLLARVENYPDLKSNQNMLALQEELSSTENRIAYVRSHFNAVTLHYNNLCQSFPAVLLAGPLGYGRRPYYELDEAEAESRRPSGLAGQA
jgi:LemA protein